jgi:membrane protease YdiL (CAAX protease family)
MLAEKPWKIEAVARLFLGVMSALCLGMALAGLVEHFTSGWPKAQSDFWQIAFSACCLEIPALVLIALFLRNHNLSWTEAFGFRTTETATAAAYGVLAGTLFVPAAWGLQALSGYLMELVHLKAKDQQIVQELQDPSLNIPEKAVIGLIAIVVAPVVEELLFRGILYPVLKQTGRPRLALWVSSALFALVHFNMESFVPLLVFALVLVYLYETFQNLLAPIVAHSLFNAANFLMLVFQDKIDRWVHLT